MVKDVQMTPTTSPISEKIKNLFLARETGVLVALIVMAIFLSLATPAFLSVRNLLNVGRQVSLLGIMSVGMTYVLISREVDLSVGSIYALVGLITGMLIVMGWGLVPALLIGLLIGAMVGFINGWLSTYGSLPSFITTLGMMSVARGAALLITNGEPVTVNEIKGPIPKHCPSSTISAKAVCST